MGSLETSIFLAICPPHGPEVHIRWKGHTTVASATNELNKIRELMVCQRKKPYDCYIYEADVPPYGLKAYELDEVDMNFYEESNPEDAEEVQRKLDRAIYEVGILAEEERKKEKQTEKGLIHGIS